MEWRKIRNWLLLMLLAADLVLAGNLAFSFFLSCHFDANIRTYFFLSKFFVLF